MTFSSGLRGGLCSIALVLLASLSSCSKGGDEVPKNSSADGSAAAIDTANTAEEVKVDESHYIYLKPEVGTMQRFRVSVGADLLMNVADSLMGGPSGSRKASNLTRFYIRQTVKGIKPDSSIDFTYRIDSLYSMVQQDSEKIVYNSSNAADKSKAEFSQYNALVGQEFGAIVSRTGDVGEVYGLTSLVGKLITSLPDTMRNEQAKEMITRQLQYMLQEYISRITYRIPNKPLAKDTSWGGAMDTYVPLPMNVRFPVKVDSREHVKGFEERGGSIIAVIEGRTTTTPTTTTINEGPYNASIKNFTATATSTARLDDKSGLLVHRIMKQQRNYMFVLTSNQQAGKGYSTNQKMSEETVVELLR